MPMARLIYIILFFFLDSVSDDIPKVVFFSVALDVNELRINKSLLGKKTPVNAEIIPSFTNR